MKRISIVIGLVMGLSFASFAETTSSEVVCKSGKDTLRVQYNLQDSSFPIVTVLLEKAGKIVGSYHAFPAADYAIYFSTKATKPIEMSESDFKLIDRIILLNPEKPNGAKVYVMPKDFFQSEQAQSNENPFESMKSLMTFKSCTFPQIDQKNSIDL